MWSSFVIFCFAAVILQEGASKASSQGAAVSELERKAVSKRQVDMDCVNDKLSSNGSAQCATAADNAVDLAIGLSSSAIVFQSAINSDFQQFCKPECRTDILEALDECGAEDSLNDFLSGMCDTNSDGDRCYEHFVGAVGLRDVAVACLMTQNQNRFCSCRPALEAAVETQGCCLKVYEEYYSAISNYDLDELYDDCDVDAPRDCNGSGKSSPSNGSQDLALNITVFFVAFILAFLQ